jgi:peroxiredoxin
MTSKKLCQPQVGEAAPDFSLPATDGSRVRLADYPKPVSITFFRHLA